MIDNVKVGATQASVLGHGARIIAYSDDALALVESRSLEAARETSKQLLFVVKR